MEIDREIWALGAYIESLEQQLKLLVDKENERYEKESKGLDEEDRDIAYHEHWEFVEMVLPRFVLNPVLVSLWALYESATIEIATYLQEHQKQALKFGDIRGKNTLDQVQKYFHLVLKVPLTTDAALPERLAMLMTLRHAIAHCNGRVDTLKKDTRQEIEKWEKAKTGVVIQDGEWVTVSMEFLKASFAMIKISLEDLLARVRAIK